ncbi:MAG: type 4a pilus biogenesis protein PilO [Candidatus Omnitrophota bacterium]
MNILAVINENKNKFFALVIILFSFLIVYKVYEWQSSQIASLSSDIVEEEEKNKILVDIGELEDRLNVYYALLAKQDSDVVMLDINNIAKDTGVKIASMQPLGESLSGEYSKFRFGLSIVAPDYNTFAKFINKLETFERIYFIEYSDIDSPSYNKDKELRANLRINTIVLLKR